MNEPVLFTMFLILIFNQTRSDSKELNKRTSYEAGGIARVKVKVLE